LGWHDGADWLCQGSAQPEALLLLACLDGAIVDDWSLVEEVVVYPVLFTIPGLNLPVHTYGVLIVTGFLLAMYIAWREAGRQASWPGARDHRDHVLDFAFWALLGGMIGARIVFILVNAKDYIAHPMATVDAVPAAQGSTWALAAAAAVVLLSRSTSKARWVVAAVFAAVGLAMRAGMFGSTVGPFRLPKLLAVWEGGLVFYGAAIGGFVAFLLYCRKHNIFAVDRLKLADMMIVGLPLAQIFGRMGCIAAGCCWGDHAFAMHGDNLDPTFPLTIEFPKGALAFQSLMGTETGAVLDHMKEHGRTAPLYPVQLMESFGNGIITLLLLVVRSRKWFHGQVIVTYGILYPILRSIMELFRGDSERGYVIPGVLSTSQFISLCVATTAIVALVIIRRRVAEQSALQTP
jgi:phosphatidylglycerol---prolipoprotein diacylglyceryl transferase